MLLIAASDSVKLVFGSIHLVFAKKFIFCADRRRNAIKLLRFNAGTFGYKLTLENTINPYASVVTKRDRFSPSIALFEEDMFEVCRYKRILNGIAVVVKRLHHVFSPFLTQFQRLDEEDLVVLN